MAQIMVSALAIASTVLSKVRAAVGCDVSGDAR